MAQTGFHSENSENSETVTNVDDDSSIINGVALQFVAAKKSDNTEMSNLSDSNYQLNYQMYAK